MYTIIVISEDLFDVNYTGKMDIPRLVLGKRLWVGTRPGHASGGVAAARPGETAPVLLPYAAAAVTTDGWEVKVSQGKFSRSAIGITTCHVEATISRT